MPKGNTSMLMHHIVRAALGRRNPSLPGCLCVYPHRSATWSPKRKRQRLDGCQSTTTRPCVYTCTHMCVRDTACVIYIYIYTYTYSPKRKHKISHLIQRRKSPYCFAYYSPLCECKFNGSCFPVGEGIPIGYRSAHYSRANVEGAPR